MVGMARCVVPARVVAGGTSLQATLAFEGVAPLHAARTSQRDVPTTLNRYLNTLCPLTDGAFINLYFSEESTESRARWQPKATNYECTEFRTSLRRSSRFRRVTKFGIR